MKADRQTPMARRMHALASGWALTCIDCHKGIAHTLPVGFDSNADLDALHDRMEAEKIVCQDCHKDMLRAPDDDWDDWD